MWKQNLDILGNVNISLILETVALQLTDLFHCDIPHMKPSEWY